MKKLSLVVLAVVALVGIIGCAPTVRAPLTQTDIASLPGFHLSPSTVGSQSGTAKPTMTLVLTGYNFDVIMPQADKGSMLSQITSSLSNLGGLALNAYSVKLAHDTQQTLITERPQTIVVPATP